MYVYIYIKVYYCIFNERREVTLYPPDFIENYIIDLWLLYKSGIWHKWFDKMENVAIIYELFL